MHSGLPVLDQTARGVLDELDSRFGATRPGELTASGLTGWLPGLPRMNLRHAYDHAAMGTAAEPLTTAAYYLLGSQGDVERDGESGAQP